MIAATLIWRCFTKDAPPEPHTATLVWYVGLLLVLGLVLHQTGMLLSQMPGLNSVYRIH